MSLFASYLQRRFNITRLPSPALPSSLPLPKPGQILLITGQSGSGKSTLLRALFAQTPLAQRLHLHALRLPSLPVVDCLPLDSIEDRLNLLSRVGLAEVYLWLRTPRQLSDGQRFRLKLALALAQSRVKPLALFCDEYASTLDTLTALMISQTLRKTVTGNPNLRCILATGRDELTPALKPDLTHACNFNHQENP